MSYVADHLAWQQRVNQEFKAQNRYVKAISFFEACPNHYVFSLTVTWTVRCSRTMDSGSTTQTSSTSKLHLS